MGGATEPQAFGFVRVASQTALLAACDGNDALATSTVTTIMKAHSVWGTYQMVTFWVHDTVTALEIDPASAYEYVFLAAEESRLGKPENLDEHNAWSIALMRAYAAADHEAFNAILASAPLDDFIEYAADLLTALVANIALLRLMSPPPGPRAPWWAVKGQRT